MQQNNLSGVQCVIDSWLKTMQQFCLILTNFHVIKNTYSNDSKSGHLILKLCQTAPCGEPMSCRDLPTQLIYTYRFRLSFKIKFLFKTLLVWSSKIPDTYPTQNWGDPDMIQCPDLYDPMSDTEFRHSKINLRSFRVVLEKSCME